MEYKFVVCQRCTLPVWHHRIMPDRSRNTDSRRVFCE